jgi:hypothetical protein
LVYPLPEGAPVPRGDSDYGGSGAPYDKDYTEIYSNSFAFVALKADGSITAWGKAVQPALPHTLIEPLASRAAKALSVE